MSTTGGEDAKRERELKIYYLTAVFRLPLNLTVPTTIWYKQLSEAQIWLNIVSEKVFSNCEQKHFSLSEALQHLLSSPVLRMSSGRLWEG